MPNGPTITGIFEEKKISVILRVIAKQICKMVLSF